jgi:hypothetical protein
MDEVVCDICFEEYNDSTHLPLQLACGHTFCKSCLIDLKSRHSSLECPHDRTVETRDVAQMVRNYLVLDMLSQFQDYKKSQSLPKVTSQQSPYDRDTLELKIEEVAKNFKEYPPGFHGDSDKQLLHGFGLLVSENGEIYRGEFRNGKRNGFGVLLNTGYSNFAGNFVDDQRDGFGLQKWISGNSYLGEWSKDKFSGKGKICYYDGSLYEGDFKNGVKEGKGIYEWPNGSKYRGDFSNDKFDGYGEMVYSNSDKYEGNWKNDKRNGRGKLKIHGGHEYIGEFKDDLKNGKGMMIYSDKSKFRGYFLNGKKHDRGIKTTPKGSRHEELWKNGEKYY